jgi:hypothetical protein
MYVCFAILYVTGATILRFLHSISCMIADHAPRAPYHNMNAGRGIYAPTVMMTMMPAMLYIHTSHVVFPCTRCGGWERRQTGRRQSDGGWTTGHGETAGRGGRPQREATAYLPVPVPVAGAGAWTSDALISSAQLVIHVSCFGHLPVL